MLVITGYAHISENKVYKFTFFDKYVLCECSDGQKKVTPFPQAPLPMTLEKTEPGVELILVPGVTGAWFRFPIGTYDKILEHVYNFKGGELLDLLN